MVICMGGRYPVGGGSHRPVNDPVPEAEWLGRTVEVTIDRPAGSEHPDGGLVYPIDYGYIEGTMAGDGEPLDAYVLDARGESPVTARVVAVIIRRDDVENKLVTVIGETPSADQIRSAVAFQEQYFDTAIVLDG